MMMLSWAFFYIDFYCMIVNVFVYVSRGFQNHLIVVKYCYNGLIFTSSFPKCEGEGACENDVLFTADFSPEIYK